MSGSAGHAAFDLLSTAINVNFLSKLKLEDDLLHRTRDASSSFPDSVANLNSKMSASSLTICGTLGGKSMTTSHF